MKHIVVTAGPIPASLDSVKIVSNKFKGGLGLYTAEKLKELGHKVTLVAWEGSNFKTELPTLKVQNVLDYYEKVLNTPADAYVLAAAVSNLMPSNPYKTKFPSHNYKVGEKFSIEFEIAPRLIDAIKEKHPRSTLIGYKLNDGSEEELIYAGQKNLFKSKANLIFANHPAWAKEKKIALTSDGSIFKVSFEDHINLISYLVNQEWYQTHLKEIETPSLSLEELFIYENYPKVKVQDYTFGSFAIRREGGFITTSRSKQNSQKELAFVTEVNHTWKKIYANKKASLNAPLVHKIFQDNPQINYLIHGHDCLGTITNNSYEFPGTSGDIKNSQAFKEESFIIQLKHHGYMAAFKTYKDCQKFLEKVNVG